MLREYYRKRQPLGDVIASKTLLAIQRQDISALWTNYKSLLPEWHVEKNIMNMTVNLSKTIYRPVSFMYVLELHFSGSIENQDF